MRLPGFLYHQAPETMSRLPSPSMSPGETKIARLGRAGSMTWRAQRSSVSFEARRLAGWRPPPIGRDLEHDRLFRRHCSRSSSLRVRNRKTQRCDGRGSYRPERCGRRRGAWRTQATMRNRTERLADIIRSHHRASGRASAREARLFRQMRTTAESGRGVVPVCPHDVDVAVPVDVPDPQVVGSGGGYDLLGPGAATAIVARRR